MGDWVQAFTDGSSLSSGSGGWGVVWLYSGQTYEQAGGAAEGDAYRMELTAVLVALSVLPDGSKVVITSDRQDILDLAKRPHRRRDRDLWNAVDFHARRMSDVRWVWTKGHDDNPFNQRADALARAAARRVKP